jgi:uncharacterized protein (TIGR02145 family)
MSKDFLATLTMTEKCRYYASILIRTKFKKIIFPTMQIITCYRGGKTGEKMKGKKGILMVGVFAALLLGACGGDSSTGADGVGETSSSVTGSSSSVVGSSSSVVQSSSSTVGSSSSSSISEESSSSEKTPSSSEIEYGTLEDTRDGQTYKTIVIGTQTWMAENLNYADSVSMTNLKGNSWCYENSADRCAKYGRLYTWTGVMNIASSYQSATASAVVSSPHQGVCPSGWHVPTSAEWDTLENYVGGSSMAGTKLKSASGWKSDGNGTNAYGFSSLPGGGYNGSDFYDVGDYGYWWSATEYGPTFVYYRYMDYHYTYVFTNYNLKTHGRSLRCLMD